MACIKCGDIYEGRVAEVVGDSVRIQDVGLARLSFGDYPRVGQTVLYYDCKGRRYVLPENDLGALLPPPEDTRRDGVFVRRRFEFFDPWEVPVERVFQYLQDDYFVENYAAATTNTMLQVPWIPRGKNILAPPVQLPEGTATQYDYARDGDGTIVADEDGNPTFTRTNTVTERFWFAPRTFDGVTLDVDAMPSAQFIETGAVWDDTANGVVSWAWGIKDGKRFVRLPFLPMHSVIRYYLKDGQNSSVLSLLARQGYKDDDLYRGVASIQSNNDSLQDYRPSWELGITTIPSGFNDLGKPWNIFPCKVFAAFESGLRENVGSVTLGSYTLGRRTFFQGASNDGVNPGPLLVSSFLLKETFNELESTGPHARIFDPAEGLDISASALAIKPRRHSIFRRSPANTGSPLASASLKFMSHTAFVPASEVTWTNTLFYYAEDLQAKYHFPELSSYNTGANIYEGAYGVIPVPESGSGVTFFCGLELDRAWANFCADMCVYGKDVYGVLLSPDMRVKITKLSQNADFSQAAPLVYDAPLADFLGDTDALTAMTGAIEPTFKVTTTFLYPRSGFPRSSGLYLHRLEGKEIFESEISLIDTSVDTKSNLQVFTYTLDRASEPKGGVFYLHDMRGNLFRDYFEPVYLPPLTPAPRQHYRPLLDPRPSEKPADTPADEWEFDKRRMYPQPTAVLSTTAGRVYVGVNYENGTAPLKWKAPKNGVRYEG